MGRYKLNVPTIDMDMIGAGAGMIEMLVGEAATALHRLESPLPG